MRLSELIRDALRFILRHRATIELAPLQTYASALVFSPTDSVVRTLFQDQEPAWITVVPPVEPSWSACMQTLDGHRAYIRSLATSKDGRWLASASQDLTVRLWDAVTGACLQTYCDCCPASDGSHIFRAGPGVYQNIKGMGPVTFSDDSQHLASVSWNGVVRIWDVARGLCIRKIKCREDEWFSITYPSDSHWITLASPRKILILHAITGACLRSHEPHHGERYGLFYSMAYSPDSKWLALGSIDPDDVVIIWNAATGVFKQKLGSGIKVDPRSPFKGSMSFSHDSQLLATSIDGTIKVWDIEKGICVKTFESHRKEGVFTIAFSLDGQWLVSATDTSIEIWDLEEGTPVRAFKDYGSHLGIIALSVDGQRLFSTSSENAIKVWDLRGSYTQNTEDDRNFFTWLTCSVDGRHIALSDYHVASSDYHIASSDYHNGVIEIWDVCTNACRKICLRQDHGMNRMKFSADGQLLMLSLHPYQGPHNEITELWHVQSGECIQTINDTGGKIALSADNQLLASIEPGRVRIRRTSTGECIQTLSILQEDWDYMAFSPDGRWFALASSQEVRLWSTANYECTQTLTLEEGYRLLRIAFSENSCWLGVVASEPFHFARRIVRIWDTATAVRTQTFKIPDTYYEHFDELFLTHLGDALGPLGLDSIAEEPHTTTVEPSVITSGGLRMDHDWITRGGKRLLRIPSEYQAGPFVRSNKIAVAESLMAWISHDGKLFWIRFSKE